MAAMKHQERTTRLLVQLGLQPPTDGFKHYKLNVPDASPYIPPRSAAYSVATSLYMGAGEIMKAAAKGDVPMLQELIADGADLRVVDEWGCTPLHIAARHGHDEMIAFLVEHGVSPYTKSVRGQTPLDCAVKARQHDTVDYIRELLAATSMEVHAAIVTGSLDRLKDLFARGGSPHVPCNASGETPLHVAAYHCRGDIVSHLLSLGADPLAKSSLGQTPLQIARQTGDAATYQIIDTFLNPVRPPSEAPQFRPPVILHSTVTTGNHHLLSMTNTSLTSQASKKSRKTDSATTSSRTTVPVVTSPSFDSGGSEGSDSIGRPPQFELPGTLDSDNSDDDDDGGGSDFFFGLGEQKILGASAVSQLQAQAHQKPRPAPTKQAKPKQAATRRPPRHAQYASHSSVNSQLPEQFRQALDGYFKDAMAAQGFPVPNEPAKVPAAKPLPKKHFHAPAPIPMRKSIESPLPEPQHSPLLIPAAPLAQSVVVPELPQRKPRRRKPRRNRSGSIADSKSSVNAFCKMLQDSHKSLSLAKSLPALPSRFQSATASSTISSSMSTASLQLPAIII